MSTARAVTAAPRELEWQVHGLRVTGLAWGDPDQPPLLALHGWLDNAASFSQLAPLMDGYHVVALDLTGHGRSDRRSPDATYQIWDDLPEIHAVLEQLGWQRCALVGHSRGAIIATLLAAAMPERFEHLVLLDAMSAPPLEEAEFPAQLRKFLVDKPRLLQRPGRVFASPEQAFAARETPDLAPAMARLLAERNLEACQGGVRWTTDARLRGASAVKLSPGQNSAVRRALNMPVLLLLSEQFQHRAADYAEQARREVRDIHIEQVAGGHHFHMDGDLPALAARIGQFLAKPAAGRGREGRICE